MVEIVILVVLTLALLAGIIIYAEKCMPHVHDLRPDFTSSEVKAYANRIEFIRRDLGFVHGSRKFVVYRCIDCGYLTARHATTEWV